MPNNVKLSLRDLVVEEMCEDRDYVAVWLAYRCQHDPTMPYILANLVTETDSARKDNLIEQLRWNIREHALGDKDQIEYRLSLPRGDIDNGD